jgi:hypothetical protein
VALESREVGIVKASLDDLELIKVRAKQVRDRQLLADATEFQMRVERWLGALLQAAKNAGHLREGRPAKPLAETLADAPPPASLKDIGVDKKLSMKAQRAAVMAAEDFEAAISAMRERMASGKAILVDPIQAREKDVELEGRRAAHAARALTGGRIEDLGRLALSGYRAG